MRGIIFITIVGVIALAAQIEARGHAVLATGHECNGYEVFKGYKKDDWACHYACQSSTDMFVYGTNDYGVKRCNSNGCKCYCEYATKARCENTIAHSGYDLYRIKSGAELVARRHECDGKEKQLGTASSAEACADKCRSSATMIAYGRTNKKCFCEISTTAKCITRIAHKGYNLYRFHGPRVAGDEKYL